MAGSRGIDLTYIGGTATETKGIARKRERTRLEIEPRKTSRRPQLVARAGITVGRPGARPNQQAAAAGGIKGAPWAAVRYSVAGDASCTDELHYSLFDQALRFSCRDRWAFQVPALDGHPKCYLEDLTDLVLTEDTHRHYFAGVPSLYSVCMKVSSETWNRTFEWQYATLKAKYASWIEIGLTGVRRGLRGG